jgi:predicted PurR-regulated permease PerM
VAVVGLVDNILRPRLVGHETKLPDLLILVSTFGGISVFGPPGIILGPVIASLFATALGIYREVFL